MVVGLAGTGLAIINESARRPDESTTGWAIGIAVIGFGYAFFNWMKLPPPSRTGFTYTSPRTGHYEMRITGYTLQRNPIYDALKKRPLYIDIPYPGWSDEDLYRMGFKEYNIIPQYN